MTANPVLLQKKYARIIAQFSKRENLSLDAALNFFYHSETYPLISERRIRSALHERRLFDRRAGFRIQRKTPIPTLLRDIHNESQKGSPASTIINIPASFFNLILVICNLADNTINLFRFEVLNNILLAMPTLLFPATPLSCSIRPAHPLWKCIGQFPQNLTPSSIDNKPKPILSSILRCGQRDSLAEHAQMRFLILLILYKYLYSLNTSNWMLEKQQAKRRHH